MIESREESIELLRWHFGESLAIFCLRLSSKEFGRQAKKGTVESEIIFQVDIVFQVNQNEERNVANFLEPNSLDHLYQSSDEVSLVLSVEDRFQSLDVLENHVVAVSY